MVTTVMFSCILAKKVGGRKGAGGAILSQEDRQVIDLSLVESGMQAAISGLKSEYSNALIIRLTPGTCM